MTKKSFTLALAMGMTVAMSAFATTTPKDTKKAETAMMTACKKEFSKEVKGKTAKEVAEWVETEENGTNADTFKKSKCYAQHEKWETTTGKTETTEEGETH